MFIDTHCHIHEATYADGAGAYARALEAGVSVMLCVGTNQASSEQAVIFAARHDRAFAIIGVHPHDAAAVDYRWYEEATGMKQLFAAQPVGIGEIGLDYFYTHSSREVQIEALQRQLQLALDYDLPISFHVREAFSDFWPILDNFHGIRGVLHSFTDTPANLEQGLQRGLYIGVNGISTFTKDEQQRRLFATIPLEKILLETDAPFLTPIPLRGKVNEPAFVRHVAEHQARSRGLSLDEIAAVTTANAHALFAV